MSYGNVFFTISDNNANAQLCLTGCCGSDIATYITRTLRHSLLSTIRSIRTILSIRTRRGYSGLYLRFLMAFFKTFRSSLLSQDFGYNDLVVIRKNENTKMHGKVRSSQKM